MVNQRITGWTGLFEHPFVGAPPRHVLFRVALERVDAGFVASIARAGLCQNLAVYNRGGGVGTDAAPCHLCRAVSALAAWYYQAVTATKNPGAWRASEPLSVVDPA